MNDWAKIIIPLIVSAVAVELFNLSDTVHGIENKMATNERYVVTIESLKADSADMEQRIRRMEAHCLTTRDK